MEGKQTEILASALLSQITQRFRELSFEALHAIHDKDLLMTKKKLFNSP